jgi:hypothetical protein
MNTKNWIPIIAASLILRRLCEERGANFIDRNRGRTSHRYVRRLDG